MEEQGMEKFNRNASLSSGLENNSLNIPKERKVDNFTMLSYLIVCDDSFQ